MLFFKKWSFHFFLLLISFLYSYLVFLIYPHRSDNAVYDSNIKILFTAANNLRDPSLPVSSSKNRIALYPVINHFKENNTPFMFLSHGTELTFDFGADLKSKAKRCVTFLKSNTHVQIHRDNEVKCITDAEKSFFMVYADKNTEIPFYKCFVCWFFASIPFLFTAFFFYIDFKSKKMMRGISNKIRKIARNEEIDYEPSENDEGISSSLAVMSAVLAEKRETLKQHIEIIEHQKKEIEKNQKIILAKEKLATIGFFSAGIAHELGNPVSALSGFLDLLEDGTINIDNIGDYLPLMKEELASMDSLIRKLLDFSSQKSNEEEKINLWKTVDKAVRLLQLQKNFKKMEFQNLIPEDVWVKGNSDVVRVFVNLFINSAHALEGKGKIIIEPVSGTNKFEIKVCDNGPGISPRIADHIFEPFFTTKSPDNGTGLGLVISKNIMNGTGGDIEVLQSSEGACFKLVFEKVE